MDSPKVGKALLIVPWDCRAPRQCMSEPYSPPSPAHRESLGHTGQTPALPLYG